MNYRKITGWFVVGLVVLIAGFDVFVYQGGGTEATISHVLMTWSYQHPAFTFAMGFICGHLFWRIKKDPT